ncbi:helix-turn-helix domain-containing protein [Vagococcus hydrophili]|uniref:Helix-turn-helix transcriptional regulator n=1 Tax=Vagococcus hydrophili TaxID=2714947 RepID=A0A6G8ARR0_9ENTE|nr:helix-turn-helix transcriptional regulator [Vagococcus hydrophili]QIL47768.1 helix-turn-helix transcriptional regulator [Vagococcus hydrophili]
MKFGERLKKLRNESGQTQETVAQSLHVSRQTISNWENERSYPDIESLITLSEVYEISLDELLKEDTFMEKKIIKDAKLKKRYQRIILGASLLVTIFIVLNIIWVSGIMIQQKYFSDNWEEVVIKEDYPDLKDPNAPKETYLYEKNEGKVHLMVAKESLGSKFRNNYMKFNHKTKISGSYEKSGEEILNVVYVDEQAFLVYVPIKNSESLLVRVDEKMNYLDDVPKEPIDERVSYVYDAEIKKEINEYLDVNRAELLEVKKVSEREYQSINS